jgi:cell division protein FtsL
MLSGWVLRAVWDAVNNLQRDIKDVEKNLSSEYVRKDDYRDDIKEIKEMLRIIFDKLDSKVDKGS